LVKEKYMAEIKSKADLLAAGYKGYTGWGETEALADYRATGGAGKYDPGGGVSGVSGATTTAQDPIALAKSLYGLQQEFKQPAIQTLQAGQPAIGEIFGAQKAMVEAEKQPLEDRYQALLKDITGAEEKAASAEFSRRGIPLSSGIVEQTIAQRMAPQIERVGLEKETGLRGLEGLLTQLTTGEAQMGLDLNTAISAIQAATGTDAITAAIQLYQYQQEAKTAATKTALDKWIAEQGQAQWKEEWPTEKAYTEALTAKALKSGEGGPTPSPFPSFGGQQIGSSMGQAFQTNVALAKALGFI